MRVNCVVSTKGAPRANRRRMRRLRFESPGFAHVASERSNWYVTTASPLVRYASRHSKLFRICGQKYSSESSVMQSSAYLLMRVSKKKHKYHHAPLWANISNQTENYEHDEDRRDYDHRIDGRKFTSAWWRCRRGRRFGAVFSLRTGAPRGVSGGGIVRFTRGLIPAVRAVGPPVTNKIPRQTTTPTLRRPGIPYGGGVEGVGRREDGRRLGASAALELVAAAAQLVRIAVNDAVATVGEGQTTTVIALVLGAGRWTVELIAAVLLQIDEQKQKKQIRQYISRGCCFTHSETCATSAMGNVENIIEIVLNSVLALVYSLCWHFSVAYSSITLANALRQILYTSSLEYVLMVLNGSLTRKNETSLPEHEGGGGGKAEREFACQAGVSDSLQFHPPVVKWRGFLVFINRRDWHNDSEPPVRLKQNTCLTVNDAIAHLECR